MEDLQSKVTQRDVNEVTMEIIEVQFDIAYKKSNNEDVTELKAKEKELKEEYFDITGETFSSTQ